MEWQLVEADKNHTYYIYYGEDGTYDKSETVYNSTLVPRFENGSYYLAYEASDASSTDVLSTTLEHIPSTTTAATSTSSATTSNAATASSSSSTGLAANMLNSASNYVYGSLVSGFVALMCYF
ncbi:unnamed protein product [Ambrosiozyma monospora]|uniref:Unnamed protein product n=1 Tax=Ambrosiozyma monospora TaxID=43982 RepID=A0ACB5TSG7_AMBMO|nr:unnamed protein product [Ambrosiozyma monospora]